METNNILRIYHFILFQGFQIQSIDTPRECNEYFLYLIDNFNGSFRLLKFKLSQGYLFVNQFNFVPNCLTYLIDRCLLCQGGYVSDQGICKSSCDQSHFLQQLDFDQLKCIKICHTISKTCLHAKPGVCLSCSGNRINPPQCSFPSSYFDDLISPNCIQYLPIESVQVIEDIKCEIEISPVYVEFSIPYFSIPQVIVVFKNIYQPCLFDVKEITIYGFKLYCGECTDWPKSASAFVADSTYLKSQQGTTTEQWIQLLSKGNIIIPAFLGINNIYHKIWLTLDGSILNLEPTLNPPDQWQYNTIVTDQLNQIPLSINLYNSLEQITKIKASSNQPKSVEYIPLIQSYEVYLDEIASNDQQFFYFDLLREGFNTYYLNHEISTLKLNFVNLYGSINCTQFVCDFYDMMMSQCNNNLHQLCLCQSIGYFLNSTGCYPCSSNCFSCNSEDICQTCNQYYMRYLKNYQCVCQDGYYDDGVNNTCQSCHFLCKTCNGNQINNCTDCYQDRILKDGLCSCMFIDQALKYDSVCENCSITQATLEQDCLYPNCYDQIYTVGEQCDDGNAIARDGCTNCILDTGYYCINVVLEKSICSPCTAHCLNCLNNQCSTCFPNYLLESGYCVESYNNIQESHSICGNYILEVGEQCDDQSLNCKNCTLVDIDKPQAFQLDFRAYYTNLSSNSNITLSINTTVLSYKFDCYLIILTIDLLEQSDFTYIISQQQYLNGSQCTIAINYTKDILTYNLIRISFSLQLENQTLLQELIVVPRAQYSLNADQVVQVQTVQSTNQGFTTSVIIAGPIAFLTGGFAIFWCLLNSLTWLNQIYFINIIFPANVAIVFEQPTWQIMNMIQIPNVYNQEQDIYYTASPYRFMQQGADALLINNLSKQLLLWIIVIGLYIMTKISIKLITRYFDIEGIKKRKNEINQELDFQQDQLPLDGPLKLKLKFPFSYLCIQSIKYVTQMKSYTIQTLNLQYLDLLTAIALQFQFNFEYIRYVPVIISYCLAYVGIALCIYILHLTITTSRQHPLKLNSRSFHLTHGRLMESLNIQNEIARSYAYLNI